MEMIALIPVFIPLIYGILLLSFGVGKNRSKRILGWLMLSATYTYLSLYFYFTGRPEVYRYFGPGFHVSVLCFFPLLLKYLKNLSGRDLNHVLLHFLPAALVFVISLPLWFSMSKQEAMAFIENRQFLSVMPNSATKALVQLTRISRMIAVVQILVYTIVMSKEIRKTRTGLVNYYSSLNGIELKWLQALMIPLFVFLISMIIFAGTGNRVYFHNHVFLPVLYTSSAFFFFMLGWFGLRQAVIILPGDRVYSAEDTGEAVTLNLSKEKLEMFFREKKPYLSSDFRITDLSASLGVNRTYMSNFINTNYGMNFCHFVNEFRVEEAKTRLMEVGNNQYKLEKVAEDCGFASLQSFSRVFKNQCNISPGNYRSKYLHK